MSLNYANLTLPDCKHGNEDCSHKVRIASHAFSTLSMLNCYLRLSFTLSLSGLIFLFVQESMKKKDKDSKLMFLYFWLVGNNHGKRINMLGVYLNCSLLTQFSY